MDVVSKINITIVAGARPNFIKIAPIINALEYKIKKGSLISYRLVHTGQHFDENMSTTFFEELKIPKPNINLGINRGTQIQQIASIMVKFEEELVNYPSDLVLVVGDVNSTMACALVAKKLNIKVAHVEGGIRSGDWSMPEEINRIVTDSITDYFFTTSKTANNNLLNSGIDKSNIFFVGNTMIDTLLKFKPKFKKPLIWNKLNLKRGEYVLLTLHRPSNVDQKKLIKEYLNEILANSKDIPIIFPVHPRTAKVLNELKFKSERLHLLTPMSYLEFNYLVKGSMHLESLMLHCPRVLPVERDQLRVHRALAYG